MPLSHLPATLSAWLTTLADALDRRSAPRLLRLLLGALFARGRRTVTSWFRAADISIDFRRAYAALWAAGRRSQALGYRLLGCALLPPLMRQASGDHTCCSPSTTQPPRPAMVRVCKEPGGTTTPHPDRPARRLSTATSGLHSPGWPTIRSGIPWALPIRALLYVRAPRTCRPWTREYPWDFHSKLELAAELVGWLDAVAASHRQGGLVWPPMAAYAKRPFLKPVLALGVVVVSRLRRDAHLMSLPATKRRPGQRGPMPTYGKRRIRLAQRASQRRGWQPVECVQYGETVVKEVKEFLATWRPAGGIIRVVIVREEHGWLAYFCSNASATAAEILAAMADRGAIEQTFKDVKEVWGAGQQQVRNVYACIGAFTVNLVWHSLVEAWAWARGEGELVQRPVWDQEQRRPSHADKRKALQQEILRGNPDGSGGACLVGRVSRSCNPSARSSRLTVIF